MNHKVFCAKYADSLASGNVDELIENWLNDENSNEKYPFKQSETNNTLVHYFPEHEIAIEPEELEYIKQKQRNDASQYTFLLRRYF